MTAWNNTLDQELLRLYVGKTHSSIEELCIEKEIQANEISKFLNINSNDTVLDIGPGYGFIASFISPKCNQLICADISNSFLRISANMLKKFTNIDYEKISYGDLSKFSNLDKIYSMAVFIHFNIYDIGIYLEQVYKCLKPGGKFLFDFLDSDYFNPTNEIYLRHKQRYIDDPKNLSTNINFNSKLAVEKICTNIGFDLEFITKNEQPWVLLTK